MRFEAPIYLLFGAAVFAAALLAARAIPQGQLRTIGLSVVFACTLSVGIFPGHGEAVIVPVLALLAKGGTTVAIGALFALVWFSAALVVALAVSRSRRRRRNGAA
jgi:hypothetical protein